VSVADTAGLPPVNDTWTSTASVTPRAAPAAGRFLVGSVQIKSGSIVIGSAEVVLNNVR
jgi:hypothetical protein